MTLTILFLGSGDISANVNLEFPSLSMEGHTGGHLTSFIPSLSLTTHSGKQLIASFPALELSFVGGTLLSGALIGQFPRFTFEGTFSLTDPEPLEITFPALTGSFYTGSSIVNTFPALTVQFTGHPGRIGDFISTLPGLNFEAFAAGYIGIDLPMFIQAINTTASILASISATFPSLGLNGNISIESINNFTGTFPLLKMNASGIAGAVVELTASFKPLTMRGIIIPGQIGDLEMTLPRLTSSITSVRSGPIEIDGTFPQFTMKLSSGAITTEVLRYQLERIR